MPPPTPDYRGNQPHYLINAKDLSDDIKLGRYMLIDKLAALPVILSYGALGAGSTVPALPTASATQVDAIYLPGSIGNDYLELYQTTQQTLMPSRHASKGLLMGGDVVDNESVEFVPGGNHVSNPLGYSAPTAGQAPPTDVARVIRATFEFADVSGSDQFFVGFRKQEAYAVPTSLLTTGDPIYTDLIGVGFSGAANPNDVKVISDINNGGSALVTDTGFDWADGGIHTLEVRLIGRKAVILINGVRLGDTVRKDGLGAAITAQPTIAPPPFTVDAGDFMIPMIFHRYDATTPGAVYLRRLEVGTARAMGLDPNALEVSSSL